MEIISFSVKRFRVFRDLSKITFSNGPIVLIGPNNQGKSSACDAIGIMFEGYKRRRFIPRRVGSRDRFDHERDYPLQDKGIKGRRWPTEFFVEVRLNTNELEEVSLLGIILKSNEVTIKKSWDSKESTFKYEILKPEKLSEKNQDQLIIYIYDKIRIVVVPAIREKKELEKEFSEIFEKAVSERIVSSKKIKKTEDTFRKLIEPVIKKTKDSLGENLSPFFKNEIKFDFDWEISLSSSINLEKIFMDDGVRTSINLKGDGIQSLLYMALITELANVKAENRGLDKNICDIYIIEEPEVHLNSSYLHILKKSINKLSEKSYVIITTHSPVFVEFYNFNCNHLVKDGKISKPKNKQEIADALGIRIDENLRSNAIALLVEGKWDDACINLIFKQSQDIHLLKSVDIKPVLGTGNLSSIYQSLGSMYKRIIVLVDNDSSGTEEVEKLIALGIDRADIFILPALDGYNESEIEDTVTLESQSIIFSKIFNRPISVEVLKASKKRYKGKWSNWVEKAVKQAGVPIDGADALKSVIWNSIKDVDFTEEYKNFFGTLLDSIGKDLKKLSEKT